MYCVSYLIRNWHDNMLCCRHDATFTGAMFDSLDEIEQWQKRDPRIEIFKIENLENGEIIKLQ